MHTSRAWLWRLLFLWLMLRLLTSVWMAFASPLVLAVDPSQVTISELNIALWPPSTPLTTWLERVLLAPLHRWDVHQYRIIVTEGYSADNGTAQFHPLFPWLATPLYWITGSAVLSLVLVSSLASILLLPAFERLARLDLERSDARMSTLITAVSPLAFVLFIPYTESLFLLLAVLCLLWARQRAWWLAGLAGLLATLTRQQGLFLIVPLAWELWESAERDWRSAVAGWRNWLALGLIPGGMFIWLLYRAVVLNDLQADFSHPQAMIYSILISPSADKVVPEQAFLWPWHAVVLALQTFWSSPTTALLIDLVLGASFLVLLAAAWPHMRMSYRLYAGIITLVSFSYFTGPEFPYMGLPRHLLLAFPVLLLLGAVFRGRWSRLFMLVAGMMGMLFLLLQYVIGAWVP